MGSFKKHRLFILVLIFGLGARIALNNIIYSKDAESFVFWGKYLQNHSISGLYEFLPGGFTPLPPLYYYISRFLGKTVSFLNLWQNEWATYLIFKIPPILSELVIAILIYWFVAKYLNKKWATASSAFYFLHPAIIYNTAVFGQIDSFVVSLAFIAVMLIVIKKYTIALSIYTLGVLSKLQDLAILPLIAISTLVNNSAKKLIIAAIAIFSIALLPFLPILFAKGLIWTALYFKELPNWYPYTSVYAYNFWAFSGFLTLDKAKFLSLISYRYLGLAFYWLIAALIIVPFLKSKNQKPKVVLFAAFLLIFDFAFFSTRVHSRYLIYSLPFAASFVSLFPLEVTALSFLIILNLMLPMPYEEVKNLVLFLNQKTTVIFFTLFGLTLFLVFMNKYKKLLER
ncbi:MAG: Integral membrane protein-like protein [Candidatus Curtissbacteria bacterium GW2011_GWA1_40_24]|uniref:Integral membrane protein-like protein n=1 Tax=Candidatus Curtissbacteria bacterium GW2011_GWA1_40_24 TaxID=1618406 RepID=A0A0G0RZ19_9BACT|nr:MAG: Integral membrane protein-like protein [Candidatus Curtissbacteria bacterium GW2011_GWA1_40_24]